MVVPKVVEAMMKAAGGDLKTHQRQQRDHKQRGAGEIAPLQRHGDGVAGRLAQRGRCDFYDPEDQRDFGNLVERCRHIREQSVVGSV
jgi:hypothetical protein